MGKSGITFAAALCLAALLLTGGCVESDAVVHETPAAAESAQRSEQAGTVDPESSTDSSPRASRPESEQVAVAEAAREERRDRLESGLIRLPEGRHGRGELRYIDDLPVLFLEGTPAEIGEQHAALLAKPAEPLLEYPRRFLRRMRMEREWPLVAAMSRVLVNNLSEPHRTELQSAIAASELDADVLTVANTMLELRRLGGCSTLLVEPPRSATGGPLFGRNFDFDPMGILQRYSVVIVYRPEDKRPFVAVGFPTLSGVLSGMNDAGLSVATLDVYQSRDGSPMFNPQGVPLAFTFRRILEECTTVKEAESLLRSAKATTWMNLAVSDETETAVFEITPENVVVRRSQDHLLSCTNHFRSPQLATPTVCSRYQSLEKAGSLEKLDIEDVRRLLHAAHQGTWTIQTMVFEPRARKLHLALGDGPTSNKPLKTLDVRELIESRGE